MTVQIEHWMKCRARHWIRQTAWPMTPPVPYSAFHLFISLAGIAVAAWLARKICQRTNSQRLPGILFLCGALLAVSEVYKQLFLYIVVNEGHYDWWYFPFQLCSLPMYLCLLLPLLRRPWQRDVVYTFLRDFALLGGIMALAEPSGLMHPYWTLTLHGLLWHLALIFISLLISFGRLGSASLQGYLHSLLLLAFFCGIATLINIKTHGAADMFYISPYYPVSQVVFHQFSLQCGIAAGIVVYLGSICFGGFICHKLTFRLGGLTHDRSRNQKPHDTGFGKP